MSNLIHDSNSTISELTKKLATQLTDRGLGNAANLLI